MPSQLSWRLARMRRARADAPAPPPTARHATSIRTSLALLVTACLLPGLLLSAYFILSDYRQNKARAVQNAIAIARAAAANLDRDLSGITAGLRVLATSSALQDDDLAAFSEQARQALPFQHVSNYVLMDESGRQHLNTLLPWGSPLPPTGSAREIGRVFQTGEPILTDLFIGPVSGRPIFAMSVPVRRDDRIVYSLSAGLFPSRIASVLTAQRLPAEWISAVLDSKGVIVARSRDMARYVGKSAVVDLRRHMQSLREGTLETRSLDGVPVVTVFCRSNVSDWTVAVGIPKAQLTHELKASLITLLVVSSLVFATAWWVAWQLAMRRVVMPAQDLLARMQASAQGRVPAASALRHAPAEFHMLQAGLDAMNVQLAERDKEREAKLAAEAANRAKTQFLSRMSHELRTPLNAILGFTQVLRLDRQEPLSPRQQTLLHHIDNAGQHLLNMITDVLDVSRIEAGQIHLALEAVDVPGLITDCQQMMGPTIASAGLTLSVHTEPDLPRVQADPTRLKQVLLNLLSNAVKYNQAQGSITLAASATAHGAVQFVVRDTGLGLSDAQLQHLFEPFNRLGREHSATPGAGIGLVICKQLLALMSSTLAVRSQPGQGSSFWFELPAAPSSAPGGFPQGTPSDIL